MRKVKIKKIKKQIGDNNLTEMFNQMIGAGESDPKIIVPKYSKVRRHLSIFSNIIKSATNDVLMKSFPSKNNEYSEMIDFSNSISSIEFLDVKDSADKDGKVRKHYAELKKNNHVRMIILTCKNLIQYQTYLVDKEKDEDLTFVTRMPGLTWSPYPFSSLNIKEIISYPSLDKRIKKYLFTTLKISLITSKEIYKTLTSPDVDVKEFSRVIIESLSKVKKSIPRCGKAFKKIEESVSLLEGNFDGYYKDFVQSQNPSTIIEGFVIDVSKTGGADAELARQFRTIINYYRKATAGKIKDPKIKKIFDLLNKNLNVMENSTKSSKVEDEN